MGNIPIFYSGSYLNNYFQIWTTGNTGGVKANPTSIVYGSPTSDINSVLSPRDNNPSNAAISTGAIISKGTDIALLFNKANATINFVVGGTAVYTGSVISTGITFSNQSPTGNDPIYSPTFTVSNPTVDTTSTITTTCSGIGAYGGPFTIVTSQSPPTTTYYTIQSALVGGQSLVLKLPGNYGMGIIGGAFSIVPSGTLVRPSTFTTALVSGTGPSEWVSSTLSVIPYSNITDVNYGDTTTYSYVDSAGPDFSNYVVTGTVSFSSQTYTNATLYIQYGVQVFPWTGIAPVSVSSGSLAYSTDGGSTYTTSFTWSSSSQTTLNATSYTIVLPINSNLNQIFIQIKSQQKVTGSTHDSSVYPTLYDMYVAYT